MVQTRGRPAPNEWDEIKPEFERLYLGLNMTLKDVSDHFANKGFVATHRQYKTKVAAWGFDLKKIKRPTWHSMYVVMKSRQTIGLSSEFLVPIRGNRYTTIRSDKILKETNRNKSVLDASNLLIAEAVLDKAGVRVRTSNQDDSVLHSQTAQWVETSEPTGHNRPSPWAMTSPMSGSGSTGPYSSQALSSADAALASPSTADNFTSINDQVSVGGLSTPVSSYTPPAWQSPTSLASVSTAQNEISRQRTNTIVNAIPDSPSTDEEVRAIAAIDSLFLDPSCSYPGLDLPRFCDQVSHLSPPFILDEEERKLAMRWVLPYISTYVHRRNPKLYLTDGARSDAKDAFKLMLARNNRYLFPYCNCMVTILGSSNQTVLLTFFLSDSRDVIDQDQISYQLTYGSPLHLTLALYQDKSREIEIQQSGFLASLEAIRMLWGTESPNYLVSQYYHAWLMLEKQRHEDAVQVLRQCLPLSEKIMGKYHIVTINCLAILARALEEMGRDSESMQTLQDVLDRLSDCVELLHAYKFRQLMRFVGHLVKRHDYGQAEVCVRSILNFRRVHFGISAGPTWEAIDKLRDILTRLERIEEAEHLWQESTRQYYQECEAGRRDQFQESDPGLKNP